MKRQLLSLLAVLSFCISWAQIGTPFDITVCDGSEVYLGDQTTIVLGGLSPNDYTVTYHFSQADADSGSNALPDSYMATTSQMIFVRLEENANQANYQTTSFMISVVPMPVVGNQSFTACDSDGVDDGFTLIDLGSAAEQIWANTGTSPDTLSILFYETQFNAENGIAPISWSVGYYSEVPFNQTIYIRAENVSSGCWAISELNITIANCGTSCTMPWDVAAFQVTPTSVTLGWTSNGPETMWQVLVMPAGSPPNAGDILQTSTNPFTVTGLACNTAYSLSVRTMCGPNGFSTWYGPLSVVTTPCAPESGQPINLEMCSDTTQGCFDLTQNNANVLGTLNPADYSITYHATQAAAENNTDIIANPSAYCVTQSGPQSTEIFVRLEHNASGEFQSFAFALTVQHVSASNFTPTPMSQCDEDNDGIVVFNLTNVAAQLNASGLLTYYGNWTDATSISGENTISNPESYQMTATTGVPSTTVFVRENIAGGCDNVYSLQLFASSNCNMANTCNGANSLCGSLGIPFPNTVNGAPAQPGIDYSCLFSQPNPTWFYIPVSQSGALNFLITQEASFGNGIDVDFICWGPFTNPLASCGPAFLNSANQVGCSYSAAPTENFTIPNAVPGQFYMLMVTNFSNQPGLITITQTNAGVPGSAEIDCTGIKMTAFFDVNGNGSKDSDEPNFSLGQFNYEMNNSGNVHHITSPNGSYSIYDIDPANSYDFGFDIDPAYSGNYALTTSSYTDIHVFPGMGMTEYFFPITATNIYDDLAVAIVPGQSPRPGFYYTNTVRYTNLGNQTVASGTISFTKPAAVSITDISQLGTTPTATGFTYNFVNLLPFETREMVVTMFVPTIPAVNLGDLATSLASIEPLSGDVSPENNSSVCSQVIIGAYDPNDKMESRGERILITDFTAEDYLYYTIRFENTGSASALNVRISDVLESQLDESTLRMVAASHNYVLDRVGNVLTWNFDDIQLPSATTDPEGGKGYVMFKVKPKPGFVVGDIIQNTASIFFDFNPPIITNTFMSEFVQTLGTPVVSQSGFAMYPNPAEDFLTVTMSQASETIAGITVYDMLGKTISTKTAAGNSATIDVSQISTGIYFVQVTTANNLKIVKKLVIQ